MIDTLRTFLTRLGELMATPAAFGVLAMYVSLWVIVDRASFDWHAVATCATLAMTLFIQRAEHRDTQAIHAKLDGLLRAESEEKLS
jgi:low affinity Fe/Cu permease